MTIWTSLSRNLTKTLINALVLSRIDYCSTLLNLLPAKATAPLNRLSVPQYVLLTV